MSRSRKKPFEWISKSWTKKKERSFRHKGKRLCHEAEIDFDPDRDFGELHDRKMPHGSWGTRCGFEVPPDPDNPDNTAGDFEEYARMQRK
jgi:hypothetical protein